MQVSEARVPAEVQLSQLAESMEGPWGQESQIVSVQPEAVEESQVPECVGGKNPQIIIGKV